MKQILLAATVLATGAFTTVGLAPSAHAAPITFNFDTGSNANLGPSRVYTQSGTSVAAFGGSRSGTVVSLNEDLYSNHRAGDEKGLGICSNPLGNSNNCRDSTEINGAELVQLDLKVLIDAGYNEFSVNADSVTQGEILGVYSSTFSDRLGTLAANVMNTSLNVTINTAGNRYLNFISGSTSGGGDVILHSLTADRVAVPEPASLALLGSAMLGVGMIRRRRARA